MGNLKMFPNVARCNLSTARRGVFSVGRLSLEVHCEIRGDSAGAEGPGFESTRVLWWNGRAVDGQSGWEPRQQRACGEGSCLGVLGPAQLLVSGGSQAPSSRGGFAAAPH